MQTYIHIERGRDCVYLVNSCTYMCECLFVHLFFNLSI